MKSKFAFFIILSFASISVFGFLAMGHEAGHNCLAAAVQGMDCPEGGLLSVISFHLDAYRNFSLATIVSSILAAFAGIALAFGFIFEPPRLLLSANRFALFNPPNLFYRRKFLSWLVFHENSPSFA